MPVTSPLSSADHDRRWQAIRRTFGASMLAKGVSIFCTMAQVPIAVHYLGLEAYGFWIALLGIATVMNFVDFGLGVGLQNTLTLAWARGDEATMRSAYLSGAASLGVLSLLILLLGLPVIFFGEWASRFHLTEPALAAQARSALAVVVIFFAVGLPLNATARLAASVQKGWIHATWIALGSLISLGLVFGATRMGASLTVFLAFACLAPLIQGVGLHFHMLRVLGWSHERTPFLNREERRRLFGTSVLFSAPQLGLALVQALPPIALTMTSGPASAGAFNILQRLFSPLSQGQLLLLAPVWPAFAEAHARGDAGWLRHGLRFSLLATVGFALALGGVAWQAPLFIHWWIGHDAGASESGLRGATAAWSIALMAGQPLLYFLLGVGRLRGLAVYGTIGYAVAIAAMFAGGHVYGAVGALSGAVIGYGLIGLLGMGLETRLALRQEFAHNGS